MSNPIINESIFKAYDIRGTYPDEINEDAVYKIVQAYAKFVNPKTVALGRDVRISGVSLFESAKQAFVDHGVNVIDIGVISTDMLYFAVAHYGYDGGVTISASHNAVEFNGMKIVREKAIPISGETGIDVIKQIVLDSYSFKAEVPGTVSQKDIQGDYISKCLTFVEVSKLKHFKVVANAMFGLALQNVVKMALPIDLTMLNEVPDGTFPKGPPNPMVEANRKETVEAIQKVKPDLGVAWDADADRFFLFDENGRSIPGYYLTAFLGKYFVTQHPGIKVLSDARLTWAIFDSVEGNGGQVIINRAGHSLIKERMRKEDVVFGGESSGHYYFKDFYFADNGLVPFLLMLKIMTETGQKVSELFDHYFVHYPISGEINTKLSDQSKVVAIISEIEKNFSNARADKIDGLSIEFDDWRANIRGSNTEPLIRLNVEAKTEAWVKEKTEELMKYIK